MLIGIDASRANRKHKSGTEWYAFYLIHELAQIDPVNQYILYTDEPLRGELLDLTAGAVAADYEHSKPHYDDRGFQLLKSPHNNFRGKVLKWPFRYLWTQGRLSLEMLFHRPDALFVPSHTLPFIHPKRSIITIHDIGFERDYRLYKKESMGPLGGHQRRFLDILVRLFTHGRFGANSMDYFAWSTIFGLKYAQKIITVSEFSKREILEVYGQEAGLKSRLADKMIVIHNGYNNDSCCLITDRGKLLTILDKYGIEKPYLFYVGRLERKKNIVNLVEAFALMLERNKQLPHHLVLSGDASFGYDEIKYMINQYNIVDRVKKTGWVEERDMPCIYSGAAAFVFPSLYEGFGIPLLEAMACQVPIAASNAASIPEVAGDAALLFDPNDTHEMSLALERIITDEELRQFLIEKGRERVKQFGWDKTAAATLAAINGL